jgi:hypothetical protein
MVCTCVLPFIIVNIHHRQTRPLPRRALPRHRHGLRRLSERLRHAQRDLLFRGHHLPVPNRIRVYVINASRYDVDPIASITITTGDWKSWGPLMHIETIGELIIYKPSALAADSISSFGVAFNTSAMLWQDYGTAAPWDVDKEVNTVKFMGGGDNPSAQMGFNDPYATVTNTVYMKEMTVYDQPQPPPVISSAVLYNRNGVVGAAATYTTITNLELDGDPRFNPYPIINLTNVTIVSGIKISVKSSYSQFKDINYRIGSSISSYQEFTGIGNDYRTSRELLFTLTNPIETVQQLLKRGESSGHVPESGVLQRCLALHRSDGR